MSNFQPNVRNIEIADFARVLEINNANTPGVSELTLSELETDIKNQSQVINVEQLCNGVYMVNLNNSFNTKLIINR